MTKRTDAISGRQWVELRQCLGLSQLQIEVVRRLFCGKSRQEIARELAIPADAARAQIDYVYREFDASDKVQLVLHVLTALREHWKQKGEDLSV